MAEVDELRALLQEVLNELCSQFCAEDWDDEDYPDSLVQRARDLGVGAPGAGGGDA